MVTGPYLCAQLSIFYTAVGTDFSPHLPFRLSLTKTAHRGLQYGVHHIRRRDLSSSGTQYGAKVLKRSCRSA
jgi:hypothetical protein